MARVLLEEKHICRRQTCARSHGNHVRVVPSRDDVRSAVGESLRSLARNLRQVIGTRLALTFNRLHFTLARVLLKQSAVCLHFLRALGLVAGYFNCVQSDQPKSLFDIPAGANPWHCALHGTVSKCPFAYMFCDAHDAPDIKQIFGAALQELRQGSTDPAEEKANE